MVSSALPFVCPVCGATSHHPEDLRHGYCARCHAFTIDVPQRRHDHAVALVRKHSSIPDVPGLPMVCECGIGQDFTPLDHAEHVVEVLEWAGLLDRER